MKSGIKLPHRVKERWQYPADSFMKRQAQVKKKRDRLELMLEMKRLNEL